MYKRQGQYTQKKDLPKIAIAHNIPYVATACPSFPFDLMELSLIHISEPTRPY